MAARGLNNTNIWIIIEHENNGSLARGGVMVTSIRDRDVTDHVIHAQCEQCNWRSYHR